MLGPKYTSKYQGKINMKNKISVLLIDDHPIICDAYKSALQIVENDLKYTFTIKEAYSIDEALTAIHVLDSQIDLIVLDIKLPASKDKTLHSGEELGLVILERIPNAKIMVATTYNDNFRIYNLLKNLNPDGLLVKNDITTDELVNAFKIIITKPPYYSNSVQKSIRNTISSDLVLDDYDRKILYELSMGAKTKDLPGLIPLSLAGIEKRKRNLKAIFLVEGNDDKNLIIKAREKGFI